MTENQRKDDLRQFLFFLDCQISEVRFSAVNTCIHVYSSRHAGEIPNGFNLCKKTIAEERGNLIPLLMKGINGSYVYDHLTGSGHSHCSVCYQYLTPMGSFKILRIFFFSLYGILSTSSVFALLCVLKIKCVLCLFA